YVLSFVGALTRSESYPRALHDALPISGVQAGIRLHQQVDRFTDSHDRFAISRRRFPAPYRRYAGVAVDMFYDHVLAQRWEDFSRSEEHTSELQSRENIVCRLMLEKKKK